MASIWSGASHLFFLQVFLYLGFTNNEVFVTSYELSDGLFSNLTKLYEAICRSQWPRGLRCRSAAARLLGLLVRIPPGAWMLVSNERCVLPGRGLRVGLITRPEESYQLRCVCVWSWNLDPLGLLGQSSSLRYSATIWAIECWTRCGKILRCYA